MKQFTVPLVELSSALRVLQGYPVPMCQTEPHRAGHCHQERLPWAFPVVSGSLVHQGGDTPS